MTLSYPLDHHEYYEGGHHEIEEHQSLHELPSHHDYGHHQIARISLGEEHAYEHHGHEDEHVDYYVIIFII